VSDTSACGTRKVTCGDPLGTRASVPRNQDRGSRGCSRRSPMAIVGGLDLHRKQITFDVVDIDTRSGAAGPDQPGGPPVVPRLAGRARWWAGRSGGRGLHRVAVHHRGVPASHYPTPPPATNPRGCGCASSPPPGGLSAPRAATSCTSTRPGPGPPRSPPPTPGFARSPCPEPRHTPAQPRTRSTGRRR